MALLLLAGIQLIGLAVVGALVWRRLERLTREISSLRAALETAQRSAFLRRRAPRAEGATALAPVDEAPAPHTESALAPQLREHPLERAARTWGRSEAQPESARHAALHAALLAAAGVSPVLGFFFNIGAPLLIGAGLLVAATMALAGLSARWRLAGWASVATAGVWAIAAFVSGAAQTAPALFAAGATIAGAAGLAHAFLQRTAASLALALIMAIAALALSSEIGFISSAGAAYAALVVIAALTGAASLRLEAVHLGAFAAALLGLFVLSGQDQAAVWFTPVCAWVGALFLGIAIVRVPQLGPRGVAIAGSGALAPLAAAGALHVSQHGLAAPAAAAAAFAAIAALLGGVIALAAARRVGGLAALRLTLWVLAAGAFTAAAAAIVLALAAPIAASAFALLALALIALDWRASNPAWRTLAWLSALLAGCNAAVGAGLLLTEAVAWEPWTLLVLSLAFPAAVFAAGAFVAHRTPAPLTAGVFEALAIIGAVAALNIGLRILASAGALMITPISFAEAGLHVALWLAAALLIASRSKIGAVFARRALALALSGAALAASAVMTLLWLTPHWVDRAPAADSGPILAFAGLGFIAPAILFGAHWVLWRSRGSELRTRLALGAAAFLAAACVTLEVLQARDDGLPGTDWLGAVIGALVFAMALGVNFAPGVTRASEARPLYFEENLHRHRRRQARRQAR